MTVRDEELRPRLRWGARLGLYYGLLAAGLATLKAALGGELAIPLPIQIPVYVAGGVVTGAIVGLLKPWARSVVGAAIVGFIAMLPISFVTVYLIATPAQLHLVSPWAQLISAAMYGFVFGPMYRRRLLAGDD